MPTDDGRSSGSYAHLTVEQLLTKQVYVEKRLKRRSTSGWWSRWRLKTNWRGEVLAKTANRWWIADLHLGHEKCVSTFKRADGSPLRDFPSIEAHDEAIIARWNDRVADNDRVYVLGDVVIARKNLSMLPRLKGKKTLVKGNHDLFALGDYLPHFDRIEGCMVFDGFAATHVPVHPDSLGRFKANVHGHLHDKRVMKPGYGLTWVTDPRYICVSVEQTDYAPLSHEELKARLTAA